MSDGRGCHPRWCSDPPSSLFRQNWCTVVMSGILFVDEWRICSLISELESYFIQKQQATRKSKRLIFLTHKLRHCNGCLEGTTSWWSTLRNSGIRQGLWFHDFRGCGTQSAESAARAAPNDGADSVHVAIEKGVWDRQSALTGKAEKASTEVLIRQVWSIVDPIRHDKWCLLLTRLFRSKVENVNPS